MSSINLIAASRNFSQHLRLKKQKNKECLLSLEKYNFTSSKVRKTKSPPPPRSPPLHPPPSIVSGFAAQICSKDYIIQILPVASND